MLAEEGKPADAVVKVEFVVVDWLAGRKGKPADVEGGVTVVGVGWCVVCSPVVVGVVPEVVGGKLVFSVEDSAVRTSSVIVVAGGVVD